MLKTIFWLLSYIRYEKLSFFIGLILLLLASASGVYAPIVAKQFIDLVITPSENSGVIHWGQITQFAAVYFGLLLISALSAYFGRFILSVMSNRLTKRLRDELFDKIQHLPIRYFDSLPAGKVVSKITNDTEVVRQNFFVAATANVLNSIIIIVGIYVVIFSLNIRLGAALLLVIPAILLWQVVFSKKAGAFTGPLRESFRNMNGKLNEIIQGMSIIQVFQQEKLVDKDQLIEKPEINIVGVIANHQFNWYICSNEMWTMDIDKYIQAYQEAGLDVDFSYLPEIQQNLHVITKSNLESYLEMYKDDWLKVTVEELISMIKRSMEEENLNSEIILEGKALLPDLFIDFDKEEFYSNHLGMKNYERYVPNGWKFFSGRFDHLIPKEEQYWIEETKKTEGTSLLFI